MWHLEHVLDISSPSATGLLANNTGYSICPGTHLLLAENMGVKLHKLKALKKNKLDIRPTAIFLEVRVFQRQKMTHMTSKATRKR